MTGGDAGVPTTLSVMERALFPEVPPTRLGRFEIVRQLGRGGMGVVYLATDPQLKRDVAIKIHGRGATERDRQRMQREAEALARLRHRNIVTVHEVCVAEAGEVFAVMEHLPGPTLEKWVQQSGPSSAEIVHVLVRCAYALAAAHEADLVHGDVKPGNVVLDNDARPKLIDFGLARPDPSGATTLENTEDAGASVGGPIAGTPRYMAPELWRGEPATPASDQFAFCVALYELLAGRPPFEPKTYEPAPRQPGRASRRVWAVLRRGLEPDPSRRFASMRQLAESLGNAKPAAARGRWFIGAGASVAAIVAAAAMWSPAQSGTGDVLAATPVVTAPCTIGEDFLATPRQWTPTLPVVTRDGGAMTLELGPGPADVFARAEFAEGPVSLLDRALEFEVTAAPGNDASHELIVGLDDAEGVFMTGILVYGGRLVFPIGPGIRGHAVELGPDDRFFRIQVEDGDETAEVISFELSRDGEAWRPIFRSMDRVGPGRLFVALGGRNPRPHGDTAAVRGLRCAATHEIGPLPREHDLLLAP